MGPLSDAEIEELDRALLALGSDDEHLDASIVDGFLVGILLNPELVPPSRWLPYMLGTEGDDAALPFGAQEAARLIGLIMRRYNHLAASIAAREAFDPILPELIDSGTGERVDRERELFALAPWASGFLDAVNAFPGLMELDDDDSAIGVPLMGILRHLPDDADDTGEQSQALRALKADLARDDPLESLDDAVMDVIDCVLDIADATRPKMPIVRTEPKLGRNAPCPCGSGKKFKHCHGRELH
jgi:uncharacterized protein